MTENKYIGDKNNPIPLQEVTVVPKVWQKDFHKNFGNNKIRKNIIRSLQVMTSGEYNIRNSRKVLNKMLEHAKTKKDSINELKKYKVYIDSLNTNYEQKRNETNNFYDVDVTEAVHRLYNVWNESNKPKITNERSIINYIGNNKHRPNYNPILNKIYNINNVESTISELAHPIQHKYGQYNSFYDIIKGIPSTIYGEFTNKRSQYDDTTHYEYETHNIIEPELTDYIYLNIPTDYISKSKRKSLEN